MSAVPKLSISYARESIRDLMFEVQPMLQAHWEEIAFDRTIPLAPRWEVYLQTEDAGILRCYTVRDHGMLIGYAAFFVNYSLHYGGSLQAAQDIIYVDPLYRSGRVGLGLIRYYEAALKAESVQVLMCHSKANEKHVYASLLDRLGYSLVDHIHCKRLDR